MCSYLRLKSLNLDLGGVENLWYIYGTNKRQQLYFSDNYKIINMYMLNWNHFHCNRPTPDWWYWNLSLIPLLAFPRARWSGGRTHSRAGVGRLVTSVVLKPPISAHDLIRCSQDGSF